MRGDPASARPLLARRLGRGTLLVPSPLLSPAPPGSRLTLRWRDWDSNPRSPVRGTALLRHCSFDLSAVTFPETAAPLTGDRGFESRPLQRRVSCEPNFLAFDRRLPAEAVRQSPPDPTPITGPRDTPHWIQRTLAQSVVIGEPPFPAATDSAARSWRILAGGRIPSAE